MDNLNFIKIYFRVFIYKIFVLKQPGLSKKEMKNNRQRMKIRLGTRYISHKSVEDQRMKKEMSHVQHIVYNMHKKVYQSQECRRSDFFWAEWVPNTFHSVTQPLDLGLWLSRSSIVFICFGQNVTRTKIHVFWQFITRTQSHVSFQFFQLCIYFFLFFRL